MPIAPNETLGQHFLIDRYPLELLASAVDPAGLVIEVGAGPGQLTEKLAQRAKQVVSFEIDKRFGSLLSKLQRKYKNLSVSYSNALEADWQKIIKEKALGRPQIIASIPYQITEPLLKKMATLAIKEAVLVVGERLGRAAQASDEDKDFSQRTLLVNTFFNYEILAEIGKSSFDPKPRTDSVIVRLTPKNQEEYSTNARLYLFRRLFLTARHSPKVRNCLKEGLIEYSKTPLTKKEALRIIDQEMKIPKEIAERPLEQLNNDQLRILSSSIP